MSDTALTQAELVVRTIAQTAVDNETYFCELDAVVGDGDFGYSLARGFEIVLSDWDELEYDDAGGLLKKTALVLTKRIGGTSGPIWGTAFLRAGVSARRRPRTRAATRSSPPCAPRSRASSSAANTDLGDKTLLDALVPAVDELEAALERGRAGRAGARGGQGARERRGHEGDARQARARVLHGRAQPRLGGRGRGRHRGDARGGEQGLAGGRAGAGLTGPSSGAGQPRERRCREEVRQRPAAVRARDAQGHRARQPRQAASTSPSTT